MPSAAQGVGGELDPLFGGDGKVLTDIGPGDEANGVAIQVDGKIVAVGGGFAGPGPANFELARYNSDGSLDPKFDGDGVVVTDFRGDNDVALGVAIQADGRIVAAGFSSARAQPDVFALARYNPDGALDPTFDDDGRVLTEIGAGQAADVAIQPDGKIVVGGSRAGGANPDDFALARYNPDGSLDSGFGGDGRVITDFGTSDRALGVAIQADGGIVAAGLTGHASGGDDFALVRYRPDGSLDPAFDGDGKAVADFGDIDQAFDVAIDAGGRIVAAGRSFVAGVDFALARFDPDGRLDPTFDDDGRVLTDMGGLDEASAVVIQSDARIVAAGSDFALARYDPDGSLDPTFDGDGRVFTDFGAPAYANALALQADGGLVAAGFSGLDFNGADFALARYLPGEPLANQPPDCSGVVAGPSILWPPDHRLRLVVLSGARDPDGDPVVLTVTDVSQDEPLDGPADGASFPDAQPGNEPGTVQLRAERSGRGDGRVYRVLFAAADDRGGSCTGTVKVGVPRNMGAGSEPLDSAPPSFPSFGN